MKSSPDKKYSYRKRKNKAILLSALTACCIFISSILTASAADVKTQENLEMEEFFKNNGIIQANLAPAEPNTNNQKLFYYALKPGDEVADKFLLTNLSDKENPIKIVVTYELKGENANVYYSLEGDEKKDISKWTTILDRDELNDPGKSEKFGSENSGTEEVKDDLSIATYLLEPNEIREVEFQIIIPEDTPYGTYKGGFSIQKYVKPKPGEIFGNVFRKIEKIEVNVVENPQQLPETSASIFQPTIYFWIALIFFTASLIFYIYSSHNKKNPTKSP